MENMDIMLSAMRASGKASTIVGAYDAASEDIVPRACVLETGSLSHGAVFESAARYDSLKRVLSVCDEMSEPHLFVFRRVADDKVDYSAFSRSGSRWSYMPKKSARTHLVDAVASMRLWRALPHMRYKRTLG